MECLLNDSMLLCRQPILDRIAEWLGISQYTYPEKVLRYQGNVGMSQRTHTRNVTKAVAAGLSAVPETDEEQQVLERGLSDCDASLAELLGGWDLSYR